ncbi:MULTISPECIES: folate family ECF transporter S component [Oscillospiraceae]|nr:MULTISPECIES: folate family ECF transporter S component [Oscillospiraceae]MCQ4862808.1 folate family ECF transporter S component [Pseudoflavonifractor phocaeensis]
MKRLKLDVRAMVQVAALIAIEIVLSRFCSIATPIVKIGFGFVPIAVCGMLYGPVWAGVAGGAADLLGAVLFPIGAYFPGFTLSAVLTGVVFGLLLHRERAAWPRLALAVAVNCLGISLCLSTYWLTILTGSPFLALLPTRIVQNLIMIPIQFIVLRLMQHPVTLYLRRAQHA